VTSSGPQKERLLASESIYDGRIIRVRVDTVALPGGREATREVVDHEDAVVLVPIDSDGNIVLVRQYRHAAGTNLLEAPAGIIERGETPDQCAQRELQEETGYRSEDLRYMGGFWSSPGFCTEFMHAYVARDLVPSKLEADPDEDIKVERLPVHQVTAHIQSGEIKDAKTVAALLLVVCVL